MRDGGFRRSLSHLTATPTLYGDPFQLNFNLTAGGPVLGLLRSLEHDPAVTAVTRGFGTEISINKRRWGALAGTAVRGALLFSTVDGHLPRTDDEIGLGTTTMRQAGAHVGSVIPVTVTAPRAPDGRLRSGSFHRSPSRS